MLVHVCPADKFIPAFIDFVRQNDCGLQHTFYIQTDKNKRFEIEASEDIVFLDSVTSVLSMMNAMEHAEKIILHSLWVFDANRVLLENIEWLKKCYWNMWGGDFYNPEEQPAGVHKLIKNMGYCLTDVDGDFEQVKQWYDTKAKHLRCFGYPSNLFDGELLTESSHSTLNIQIGNSADPSNNHLAILPKLAQFINQDAMVYAPLSYGNKEYADQVEHWGKSLLADQFEAITEPMEYHDYQKFMGSIDIAVFNHDRQQALGNIIPLLGMGKKVHLNTNTTHCQRLLEQQVKIFNIDDISGERLPEASALENHHAISHHYSRARMTSEWTSVFTQ